MADSTAILPSFGLDAALIANLPPDLRDRLLDYVQTWGTPNELLDLIVVLREVHGPLLFLLDYQAAAHLKLGDYAQAADVNERRQRRSPTIGSQAMEAQILLAMGNIAHARAVADDLAQAHPRNLSALHAAALVDAGSGQFEQARLRIEGYLAAHPGDLSATLIVAILAQRAGSQTWAAEYVERLGPGVPTSLDDGELQQLVLLLREMEKQESAQAVELELARRRSVQQATLAQMLAPLTNLDATQRIDGEELFRRMSGPESLPASPEEQRKIQLAAIRHFGFSTLRSGQTETIASVLRGESILTVMPTGAGKSLCYQLPALTLPRTSLVISPLIALMKDQVESLPAAARATATFINSTLNEQELAERMAGVAAGKYKLVYAAPERLRQREFLRALRRGGLDLFIVDEAHCVSLWGHDFRPDYLFLQEARRELGNPTTLAMTATAPPRVRDEILDYMRNDLEGDASGESASVGVPLARQARVITLDIFRDNLHLSALRFHNEEEKLAAVLKFVQETSGSGIVYVNTRHKSESLAYALRQVGVKAEAYHAGLEARGDVQDRFMADQTRVVVATVAFGMGIDKSDIRFIVHFHPSRSLAGYYQEVGRAGRDGKPSQGVLFYSNNDWANLRRWAKADEYSVEFLEKMLMAIAAQLGVSDGDQKQTLSGAVEARRLQQVTNTDETLVRVAISLLERADLLSRSFDIAQEATIGLPRKLPASAARDADFRDLLKGLALTPGKSATFRLNDIGAFMGWGLADCEGMLLDWQSLGYLTLQFSRRAMFIELPPPTADRRERLERLLSQSAALSQRRIDDMVGYATSDGCRHGYISAHFGSPPRSRCNVCDSCTGVRPDLPVPSDTPHLLPDDADIEPMIIDCLISLSRPVGRSGLARILVGHLRAPVTPDKARHHGALKPLGESGVLEYVDDLLENNRLRQYERQGYLVLAPTMSGRAEAEVWLNEHPDLAAYGEARADETATVDEEKPEEVEKYTALQKALWLWRRRAADELGQPPYMILSNELMLQIAETRPQTLEQLAALHGMGTQRMHYYGPTILDFIKLHPSVEGDAAMLVAQRAAPPEARTPQRPQHVSPRMEKLIYMKMQELRQKRAISDRLKSHEVASNTLLKEIARIAPRTLSELQAIAGFQSSALRNDGPQIVTYIAALNATQIGE
jgi:ATP-dependent DNA helicase RecQ